VALVIIDLCFVEHGKLFGPLFRSVSFLEQVLAFSRGKATKPKLRATHVMAFDKESGETQPDLEKKEEDESTSSNLDDAVTVDVDRETGDPEAQRSGPGHLDKETLADPPNDDDEGSPVPQQHPDLERTPSVAEQLPLGREVLFVGIVCLAQFTTQVGLGQALFILPVIGRSFGLTDPGELSWLIAGYSLTVGTFILLSGRMGDLFGYKRMLLLGFAWFAVWSMIAGLAVYSNHVLFVFARVFSGIGPAITLPNGLALLGATYKPGPRKDMVFALFGACAPGKWTRNIRF
jgi:hypothetical protein